MGGALRSPASAALGLEWGIVDASTAHSAAAFARLSFDDDGFMCCGKNQSDGGTWQTSLYRSRLGGGGGGINTDYRGQDGFLVGKGFDYENFESPFLPVDAEMFWNDVRAKTTALFPKFPQKSQRRCCAHRGLRAQKVAGLGRTDTMWRIA